MSSDQEKTVKRLNREELKKAASNSALAEAFVILSDDMSTLKEVLESMEGKFDKLHKVIVGDPEFQAKGIIDHGKESEARITRVEIRSEERDKELITRIEKLEGSYKWLSGAAFIVGIVVTFVADWIKNHLFK